MRNIVNVDDTDALLLIYASNAFVALNRADFLHNIRVILSTIAVYGINTYRELSRLFIVGGQKLNSSEGTREGVINRALVSNLQNSWSLCMGTQTLVFGLVSVYPVRELQLI